MRKTSRKRSPKVAIDLDKSDFLDVALELQADAFHNSSTLLSEHPSAVDREVNEAQLAQELVSRQWTSSDLVNHALGELVPLDLAARILYLFLAHGVLSVATTKCPSQDIPEEAWAEICARAAFLTALQQGNIEQTAVDEQPPDTYVWRWHLDFDTSKERHTGTVDFLNVVGVLAYVCAMSVDDTFAARRRPALRFSTMPNPQAAFPLPNNKEDSRPDLFALPYSAFRKAQPSDTASTVAENTRILPMILANFPNVFSHAHKPEVDGVSKGSEDTIPPLQFMSYTGLPLTSTSVSFEQFYEQISLLSHAATRPTNLSSDLQAMFDADKLDVSYACWPGILLAGETKESNIHKGIMQELVYMQQQRCTQPHLRSVLGLACTADETVFLRADAIGTERHHIRNTASTGVVELIQLVLGLTLADDEHSGVHPAFVFQDVARPFAPSKEAMPIQYRHRQAVYMDVGADSAAGEATRFYLDYLVDSRGSLTGRHTVVWSAFREVDACDPSICEEHLGSSGRVYVGPYALKMYYADMGSRAQKTDIEHFVKQHAHQDGAKYVLLPERTWRGEFVHQSVRGFAHEGDVPETVRRKMIIRREIVSMSPLKRTLAQYQTVQWLYSIGVLHRDISNGNILLASEEPSTFIHPQERTVIPLSEEPRAKITLVRRKNHEPTGVVGLLHDLDMAGGVNPPAEECSPTARKFPTGTLPYMSVDVLQSRRRFHRVQDDMQSVFFVAYLFAFTYGAPATFTYPFQKPSHGHRWPTEINSWAFGPNLDMLGSIKSSFFSIAEKWLATFEQQTLAYWEEGSQHKKTLKELLLALHDGCLWYGLDDGDEHASESFVVNVKASPSLVIEVLDRLFARNPELYRLRG
ncbi:hypothetical protein OH76DRAFT_1512252 [Lentinus brumalis]|uniref:Fungal-type protein kinase domain-containing protein n=1 Tax=Lentinus brumalis TaxID=2498619 RepID=A0A371DDA1_9APHY|nr:hypothetical protein OH76DRAFT_1512252 [Polyporus brumalis]